MTEKDWWKIFTKPKSPEKDPSVGKNLAKQNEILENTADTYATNTNEAIVKENDSIENDDDIRTPKDDAILNKTFEIGNSENKEKE